MIFFISVEGMVLICLIKFVFPSSKQKAQQSISDTKKKAPLSLPQLEMLLNVIIMMILKVFDISFTAVSYL